MHSYVCPSGANLNAQVTISIGIKQGRGLLPYLTSPPVYLVLSRRSHESHLWQVV